MIFKLSTHARVWVKPVRCRKIFVNGSRSVERNPTFGPASGIPFHGNMQTGEVNAVVRVKMRYQDSVNLS